MSLPLIGLGAKALGAAFGVVNKLAVPVTALYGGYELSKIPNSIKEGILTSGPNDLDSDSRYGFKVDGPINSLALKFTGDTPKTLEDTYIKRERKKLLENPVVQERISALGLDSTKIDPNLDSFLQQTNKPFQDYQDLQAMKRKAKLEGITPLTADTVESLTKKISEKRAAEPTSPESQLARDLVRERKLDLKADQRHLQELQLIRDKMIDARSEADRNFNLQLQQMTNQNRRLDREDARSARKDQQALYALILQSLNNLNI